MHWKPTTKPLKPITIDSRATKTHRIIKISNTKNRAYPSAQWSKIKSPSCHRGAAGQSKKEIFQFFYQIWPSSMVNSTGKKSAKFSRRWRPACTKRVFPFVYEWLSAFCCSWRVKNWIRRELCFGPENNEFATHPLLDNAHPAKLEFVIGCGLSAIGPCVRIPAANCTTRLFHAEIGPVSSTIQKGRNLPARRANVTENAETQVFVLKPAKRGHAKISLRSAQHKFYFWASNLLVVHFKRPPFAYPKTRSLTIHNGFHVLNATKL